MPKVFLTFFHLHFVLIPLLQDVIDEEYSIIFSNFQMIADNRINVEVIGVDYDILIRYIRMQTPVFAESFGRIQIDNACLV